MSLMRILTGQDRVSHDLVKTRQSPPIASVIIDILAAVEHGSASLRSGAGDSQYWSQEFPRTNLVEKNNFPTTSEAGYR